MVPGRAGPCLHRRTCEWCSDGCFQTSRSRASCGLNAARSLHEAPHVATHGQTYVICGHRMHESLMAFELAMSAGSTGLPANIACFIPISDVNASQSQYSQ